VVYIENSNALECDTTRFWVCIDMPRIKLYEKAMLPVSVAL